MLIGSPTTDIIVISPSSFSPSSVRDSEYQILHKLKWITAAEKTQQ